MEPPGDIIPGNLTLLPVSLTGLSATSSVGSVEAYNTLKDGVVMLGVYENWGESGLTVSLTGSFSQLQHVGTSDRFYVSGLGNFRLGDENGWGTIDRSSTVPVTE